MTDSSILSSVFYNALTANVNDGAANKWVGDHTYGFPVNFEAQYGVKVSGNSQIIGHEFDGAAVAQLRLNGGPATVSGIVQWANNTIGTAHGVEIANGIANINMSGLVFNPANGNIPNAQAVVLDSGLPSQSLLTSYPNIGDVNIMGHFSQTGANAGFNGPPGAAAQIVATADQTTGTNADLILTPRTAAFGAGLVATGNASSLKLQTNFNTGLTLDTSNPPITTIAGPTTINNATFKVTTLGVSTAVDTVCYSSVTGLFTEEPTGTTCTVSDETKKLGIQPVDPGHSLEIVLGSSPISYYYIPVLGDTDYHLGFGAQTMATIAPELVHYEDGKPAAIKQLELLPITWAAMKEQQQEIETLKILALWVLLFCALLYVRQDLRRLGSASSLH